MRVLHIHAHFDDFEFCSGGVFEMWRRRLGKDFTGRIIVCTDGKAGHHFRTREETGAMRLREQQESARLGGFELRQLRLPDGSVPREACMQVNQHLLAALWKEIREFRPDYLICPPMVTDPLAGVHVDHITVAEAVRKVAFMINVPHAFTPEFPADETKSEPCRVPVILNTYDSYAKKANCFHLTVDVDEAFDMICQTSWCHQSQIVEWMPWVAAPTPHPVPASLDDWRRILRNKKMDQNRACGTKSDRVHERFAVTSWGGKATRETLLRDIPGLSTTFSQLDQLTD